MAKQRVAVPPFPVPLSQYNAEEEAQFRRTVQQALTGVEMAITSSDYNLDVLRGLIEGHSMLSIRGHDETVPNGGPFGLSPGFGGNGYVFDQSAIDRTTGTPAAVSVSSSNANDTGGGSGALTVRIVGLDASGNAQVVVETMNGQTAVTTTETWSSVTTVVVLTTGSGNVNAGIIYVGTGTVTSGVPAVRMLSMEVGHNISLSGYFVVPLGKTLYIRQFIATVGSSNKDVEVSINTSAEGVQWYKQGPFGLEAGDFTTEVIALPGFGAGTHLKLEAEGNSVNTIVTAILGCELVDD